MENIREIIRDILEKDDTPASRYAVDELVNLVEKRDNEYFLREKQYLKQLDAHDTFAKDVERLVREAHAYAQRISQEKRFDKELLISREWALLMRLIESLLCAKVSHRETLSGRTKKNQDVETLASVAAFALPKVPHVYTPDLDFAEPVAPEAVVQEHASPEMPPASNAFTPNTFADGTPARNDLRGMVKPANVP